MMRPATFAALALLPLRRVALRSTGSPSPAASTRPGASITNAVYHILRNARILDYRGKPDLHEVSAVRALVGLSNLIADANGRIASIDVNPFLINAKTGVAVDALVVLNNDAAKAAAGHPKAPAGH